MNLSLSPRFTKILYLFFLVIFFYCQPDKVFESSANDILSISSKSDGVKISFDSENQTISIILPYDYEASDIQVNLIISQNAIHSLRNSSLPVVDTQQIKITAEDGSIKIYNVSIIKEKNNQNLILAFKIEVSGVLIEALIDHEKNEINLDLPTDIDLSTLQPLIEISDNASVSPNSQEVVNFENDTSYTVLSESGEERIYKIIVRQIKSDQNFILNFSFPIDGQVSLVGEINNDLNTITIEVPYLFDISEISPEITISERANLSFESGTKLNFENSVQFTVTAENGSEKNYNVIIQREANTENYILSFSFLDTNSKLIEATLIDHKNNIITIEVPIGFDITELSPEIKISPNATISPDTDQVQNFEKTIKYSVMSQSGEERIYSIKVEIEKSNENFITKFQIHNQDEVYEGIIDNDKNTITIEIPYTLDISNTTPSIEISEKSRLNPELETPQNFEKEVAYIVTAENGAERTYIIIIDKGPNPEGIIFEYKVSDENNTYFATIDQEEKSINLSVPFNFDYENAKVLFNFSDHATVISSGNSLFDYKYLVISESGNRNLYSLNFTREANTENFILSFIVNIEGVVSEGVIDNEKNTITVNVPFTSDTTTTTPIVEVSENASYVPTENTEIDLSNTTYTVQSESGDLRFYTLVINKEKSGDNTISSFNLVIENQTYYGKIDNEKNEIVFQVPGDKDLSNLIPIIELAKFATLFPSSNESQNFESTVVYSVAAENDDLRNYSVVINELNLNTLTDNYSLTCDEYSNFSQWFGGDDRAEFKPRNVGAGQAIRMESDLHPTQFSIFISNPFKYFSRNENYPLSVTLKLTIRNEDGSIIGSQNTSVPPSKEGWIDFNISNLDLFLQKDVVYIFTIHMPDAEKIEANTGIRGGTNITDSGICYLMSYSATSEKDDPKDLNDWDSWYKKGYDNIYHTFFNFKLVGKK